MSRYNQVPTLMIVLILVISCFGCTMSASECTPGEAKLVDGSSDNTGVLEICLSNSTWSTVCYDYLGCNDFLVACRQAGFDNVLTWNRNYTAYNIDQPRTGFYRCDGSENTLANCTKRTTYTIASHCYRRSVVTLTCASIPGDASCDVENDIRLYGGRNRSEGQLQVCRSKQWADVCSYYGNLHNYGHIACQQLGYKLDDHWISVSANGHFYKTNSSWTTRYHYEYQRFYCYNGGHTSFSQCLTWWGGRRGSCGSTCYGTEVAVTCQTPPKTDCKDKDVRLVGGRNKFEGWVEVCVDGIWGKISGRIEGRTHDVICSTLGFNDTGNQILRYTSGFKTTHSPRLVKYVNCCDRDKTFSTCDMHYSKKTDGASSDLAVRCVDGCTHGRMRLSGGNSEHEGNVEVCVSGIWRGVGLSEWDNVDANVVCQHLYPERKYAYAIATNSSVFTGSSSRSAYYNQLNCGGAETSINNCIKQRVSTSTTLTGPTAAVYCKPLCEC